MKKHFIYTVPGFIAFLLIMSSCFHVHDHDMSITTTDDEDVYRFRASFDEGQTREVQRIIKSHLHNSVAFNRGFIDMDARLDDGTVFHIKSRPGRLRISFDKDGNTQEGCDKVMEMCDEIKDMLAREEDQDSN